MKGMNIYTSSALLLKKNSTLHGKLQKMKKKDYKKTYYGEWFLPQHNEHKLAGILEVNSRTQVSGLKLYSEIDFFGKKASHETHHRQLYPEIILGNIHGLNPKITLYSRANDRPVLENYVGSNIVESFFFPELTIIGEHYTSKEELCFKRFSFQFTYLGEWIDANRFFIKEDWNKKDIIITCWDIPDTVIEIYPDCMLRIVRSYRRTGALGKEVGMSIRHSVVFESKTQKSIDEYYALSEKMQIFLLFAVGIPSDITGCYSYIDIENSVTIHHSFIKKSQEKEWVNGNEMFLSRTNLNL
jgi:hypothetical protein